MQPRAAFDGSEAETNFTALERIAAFVVAEGLSVVGAIFKCLAKRKTQVEPIDERCRWEVLVPTHRGDFLRHKSIGLEIRKTPIGIPEAGGRRRRGPVRLYGFLLLTQGLQHMGNGQVHARRARRVGHQVAVRLQGLIEAAESDAHRSVHRAIIPIGRLGLK